MKNIVELLEEIRSIAQMGLTYTKDNHDKIRFEKLLSLAADQYSDIYKLDRKTIAEQFKNEVGSITPKVGVNGIITNENGQFLLEKRADDHKMGLIGGWIDPNETPEIAIKREFLEETQLEIDIIKMIGIVSRKAGDFQQPHSTIHILYHCTIVSGTLQKSYESDMIGYFDPKTINHWHRDHLQMIEKYNNYSAS